MAKREQKRLTDVAVRAKTEPGRYADGGNLFLVVGKSGAKKWTLLYRWQGKLTEMGLGSLGDVPLAEARRKAAAARALLDQGQSPLEARRAEEAATAKQRQIPTFGAFALDLLDRIEEGFENPKHRQQWRSTLTTYAAPIWDTAIDQVETEHILKCLTPIWRSKPETASRVRGRIERVLSAAKAKGLRSGENPALWRGHLDQLLPRRQKLTRGHHAALAYDDMPQFLRRLRESEAIARLALEFLILTAARTSEVLGATWTEIVVDKALWVIPAERMKARKEHRVPLCARALSIVKKLAEAKVGAYVFPGQSAGEPLSTGAFDALLDRMGHGPEQEGDAADRLPHITAHGFRSSFSDWASEVSTFSAELRETALAHTIQNKAEAAYRRGDALDKRRKMMEAWAAWCDGADDAVIPFKRASA